MMVAWEKIIIPLSLALTLGPMLAAVLYWVYANNSSDTKEMRAILFESKPYDIRGMELEFKNSGQAEAQPVAITHPDDIAEVLNALATRVEENPGSDSRWTALLSVRTAKRTVAVEVVARHGADLVLKLKSDGHGGWNLGTYRCPQLEPVLARIAGLKLEAPEIPIPVPAEKPE